MSVVLALLGVFFRKRKPGSAYSKLYNPRRKRGFWLVRYSRGQLGVSEWTGHGWRTVDNRIRDLRPMTPVKWLAYREA